MSGMVAYIFNPSTQGGSGRRISEFEASMVYKVSLGQQRLHREKPWGRKPLLSC